MFQVIHPPYKKVCPLPDLSALFQYTSLTPVVSLHLIPRIQYHPGILVTLLTGSSFHLRYNQYWNIDLTILMKDDERNGQPYYCDCFVGKKEQKIEEICYNNGLRARNFVIYLFVSSFIIFFFFCGCLVSRATQCYRKPLCWRKPVRIKPLGSALAQLCRRFLKKREILTRRL